MTTRIERARPQDYSAVVSLLAESRLPETGLDEFRDYLLVARDGEQVIGCAAIEPRGVAVLLRSVAVAPAARTTGLGSRLVDAALGLASSTGARRAYLLTETAAAFFARRGFEPVTRSRVPAAVTTSVQFRGVCCASAVAMTRTLSTEAGSTKPCTRPAAAPDIDAIARIYNQGIEDRLGTFETRVRSRDDIRVWFDGVHPIVVVERQGHVVAFAATSTYRPNRPCYAGIAEFSVYVDRAHRGQGAGTQAMAGLIDAATQAGYWKLVSRVFDENVASRRLLSASGFREVGIYEKHGRLDGVWRDVVIVERLLLGNIGSDVQP